MNVPALGAMLTRAAMRPAPAPAAEVLGVPVDRGDLVAVFVGGAVGAIARAALVEALPPVSHGWPWATFAANLLAALLLGYLVARLRERPSPRSYTRALLGTGLCGALSTFSTMMLELLRMIDAADWALLAGYTVASVGGGLAMMLLSGRLARRAGHAS
jgi:CrcB protein